jgi:hypothetical protein
MRGITVPFALWLRTEYLSRHKGNQLLVSGEVDSLLLHGRRRIFVESYLTFLDRQRAGLARAPAEKARAIQEYRESADRTLARHGRGLSRGAGKPGNKKAKAAAAIKAPIGQRQEQPQPEADLFLTR